MITGYDRVVIARTPVGAAMKAMLDVLHSRWPDMLVALGDRESGRVGPFLQWGQMRREVPSAAAELYVARDAVMEQRWDEVGYSLMEGGEGPFALLYEPAPQPAVAIQINQEPYERKGFGFNPYKASLITAGLSLVTIVTPDEESSFSRNLFGSLHEALTKEAS
ncbi:hypothetical protein [Actinoplanes utahensis]|uniref:Uncharacterized protein n=1 Tax=Actinoplanes utahensis TaxID=1869 RepID=A0A0A6UN08_ACTUT|nr:hypothetical protein [Actinoplanes utahensis]KHD75704.1 hypothetical protein MB27_20995 [Actinoplanes utahensis]GIF34556.1 hypothetical protein Aut01nite_75420 [Actinoplanes utahensis]